ncbi:hypothetical protein [Paenibacillus agricola]|uniref:Uncharacterized protein n=1 Tax=Paenibacillus agricola TaxID=2716264 RepID=A0ABX0JHF6_9BACL|nr:hypothetical protein [Paenibacillus agricola]NHN35256.1 hypothetical protein [Paenibacillus agricola]
MKKVLLPTVFIASLVIASATALAAVDTTSNITQPASVAAVSAAVNNDHAGTIEYAKKTLFNPDGSVVAVNETWADAATRNQKSNYEEPVKGTDSMQRLGGAYVLDNGNTYIKVATDAQGNLVGYELTAKNPDQNWSNSLVAEKQDYINEYKEGTRRVGWTDEGIVQTVDGQSLRKLSRTDKSAAFSTTYTESVFLDDSGLPVQGEIYEVVNGTANLLYTYVYEFKNVSNDGSLFDAKGIPLQEIK